MADQQLYDIQGKPIRIGMLVAVPYAYAFPPTHLGGAPKASLVTGRVVDCIGGKVRVSVRNGAMFTNAWALETAVLEEPVWPNS